MNHNGAPFVLVAVVMNTYMKNREKTKKKHNRRQHNTDDGGQAVGEEIKHVQMIKHIGEEIKQQ